MTQNLRLVGSRTLTSADSNVTSDFTLTASDSGTWCTTNDAACNDKSMVLDSGNTAYGTYYNWYAATAGTGKYSTSGNASSSVCPNGWRLPTGSTGGEFQALYDNYESSALMQSDPAAFVLPGYRNGSSTFSRGSDGLFWSSTANSSNRAYDLYFFSSNVNPAHSYDKYIGFTVRCVAQ